MEDTFRVRVDKVFGSLTSSSSSSTATSSSLSSATNITSSSSLTSLWSLTDAELQRNEWIRDKDEKPDPFPFEKFETRDRGFEMEKDLDELEEEEEEEEDEEAENSRPSKPDGFNDEEWEIKNSIGRDCTLDFEEEEDAYDKVAVGKERTGDRLYMSGVIDYLIDSDKCNVLPNSFNEATRDPRANVMAAKIRLKEDAEAAKKMNALHVTEKDLINSADGPSGTSSDDNPKSILKRKGEIGSDESQQKKQDSKSQKRVRFDPECKDHQDEESGQAKEMQMETDSVDEIPSFHLPPDYPSGVPDYMRNPTKYMRYTFDESSDVDDKSNRQAYMDFLSMVKKPSASENQVDSARFDLPKSITFIPKRKSNDAMMDNKGNESKQNQDGADEDSMLPRNSKVGIAASETVHNEASEMEVDESETSPTGRNDSRRSGRQYRTKAKVDTDD